MEAYFLIDTFEDGYYKEDFVYEEVLYEYATTALQIPKEYISSLTYDKEQLEIILNYEDKEESKEDWFVNLEKLTIT